MLKFLWSRNHHSIYKYIYLCKYVHIYIYIYIYAPVVVSLHKLNLPYIHPVDSPPVVSLLGQNGQSNVFLV